MDRKDPHADATYKIIRLTDLKYGVEVTIPDSHPAKITSFATEADAEKWIAMHKAKAAEGSRLPRLPRRRFGSFVRR